MRPPLVYRCLNAVRRWCERDSRLRVEQWKAVMAPEKKKAPEPINLIQWRDRHQSVWEKVA